MVVQMEMIFQNKEEADFNFQLLGITLKFDDILLLFIIYILYIEHTENNLLFIILFMLLIS